MTLRVTLIIGACVLLFARPGNLTGLDALIAAALCLLICWELAEMDEA